MPQWFQGKREQIQVREPYTFSQSKRLSIINKDISRYIFGESEKISFSKVNIELNKAQWINIWKKYSKGKKGKRHHSGKAKDIFRGHFSLPICHV